MTGIEIEDNWQKIPRASFLLLYCFAHFIKKNVDCVYAENLMCNVYCYPVVMYLPHLKEFIKFKVVLELKNVSNFNRILCLTF